MLWHGISVMYSCGPWGGQRALGVESPDEFSWIGAGELPLEHHLRVAKSCQIEPPDAAWKAPIQCAGGFDGKVRLAGCLPVRRA